MKKSFSQAVSVLLFFAVIMPILSVFATANGPTGLSSLLKKDTGCYVEGNYLIGVKEEQTVSSITALFDSSEISVVNKGSYVGTGSVVRHGNSELTVIVKGDANGDGKLNPIDCLLIKKAILGNATLTEEFRKAADINNDGKLSSIDFLQAKKHYIHTYNIFEKTTKDFNGTKVAYIPLDDRPVNTDRVEYLAQAAGFDLIMPNADYYATKLDETGVNSNGTKYGNREELLNWLKQVDAEYDYFIISLDQMLSGGLVNSRSANNTDLTFEYSIIDYLAELSKSNYVYFFDTVMRLASTVNYNGYQSTEYDETRKYGKVGRKVLSGSALTVDGIIAGYRYNTSNAVIPTNLTEGQISSYLASRERKLRLADYFLTKLNGNYQYFYIGVDDSSPTNTIQTNEINYIKSKLVNGRLFGGTDEIGLLCLARLTSDIYNTQIKIAINYFGGGENSAADDYDIGTLKENIDDHIISVDAKAVTSNADLDVLVLTKPVSTTLASACNALISKLQDNIEKQIPTIVIDASLQEGTLQNLFDSKNIPLLTLVGYSNWNTVGNSIGIALSQGVARVIYLKNCKDITKESNIGFVKSMTFSYIKDIGYKIENGKNYSKWLNLINKSPIISELKPYTTKNMGTVSISNIRQPWKRPFEITFDINIK